MAKDSRLKRAGVSGYNKPKRTPGHPKKSHIVVAKVGDKIKIMHKILIRVNYLLDIGVIRLNGNGYCQET
jgi:hypothetical protein